MNDLIQSSSNPEKVSMTIQGMLVSIVPIIIAVAKMLEIPLTESMLMEWIQLAGMAVSAVLMFVGFSRKVINIVLDALR